MVWFWGFCPFGLVSLPCWCLVGLVFLVGFGSGLLLVVGGSFGGDLLLNFLIFSNKLSLSGFFWGVVVRLVGWGSRSGFNLTRYLSILFGLVFISGFILVFSRFWFWFGLSFVKTELSSACFLVSGPLFFLSKFLK